jgi:hypothetical protein
MLLFTCVSVHAQKKNEEPDSLKVYRKVEKAAKKKKFTYWLYKEIFNLPDQSKNKEKQRKQVAYENYQGRVIRNIEVETLEPFGYSVQDTSVHPKTFLEKGGNVLHQRTVRFAIINQLFFRKGDTLDYLRIKESERILRQAPQVKEVAIYVRPVKGTNDSVDVLVREQDYWSKDFGIAITPAHYTFNFSDKNFLGLSHHISNDLTYNRATGKYTVSGSYILPYVGHTLIVPTLIYNNDKDNFTRGVSVSRPFISPLIKWAGSIDIFQVKSSGYQVKPETDTLFFSTKFLSQDYWLGRSFSLSKDTSEETRSTRFIVGARYLDSHYFYRAPEAITPGFFTENRKLYLAGAGISNRTFYRDYYVYRFGTQEDVPTGRLINFTAGYEARESGNRIYSGIQMASGNHFDNLGYVVLNMGAGSFFKKSHAEQSVFQIGMGYFSDLIQVGRTHFRQFLKMNVIYGFNRIRGEAITLNDAIKGFNSDELKGTKSATISLQTQAYLPFQLLGFRFAPFFFVAGGLIADESTPLTKSKLYQGYGLGLLVRNELLVIKSFQIAIGFYPFIPGRDAASIKFNPLKSYDFSFVDFEVMRPSVVGY